MPEISEDLLQFIWQYRLLKPIPLITASGKELSVLRQGELNRDSGPDFFNAQINLGGLVLAGNIELHVRSSDWHRHGHHNDDAYSTIILHVVYVNDEAEHNAFELLELKPYISEAVLEKYKDFEKPGNKIPCSALLGQVNDFAFTSWAERMAVERLETKMEDLDAMFNVCKGDYLQVFYVLMLRNFGFKVNSLPFEMLALQLPLNILLRHRENEKQIQALLLGMAGMLDEHFREHELHKVQNEFEFLKVKYGLVPLDKKLFKFARTRPANFPGLRLAQFAALVCKSTTLLTRPTHCLAYNDLLNALMVSPQGYWSRHYSAGGEATHKDLTVGLLSAENIIINTIAPFLFYYGRKHKQEALEQQALHLLETCGFENNIKTKLFSAKKPVLNSASTSQGLIHLFNHYCSKKGCLKCGIGASILKT